MGTGVWLACLLAAADMEIFIQTSEPEVPEPAPQPEQPAPPPRPAPQPESNRNAPIEASARTTSPRAFLAVGNDPADEVFVDGYGDASVEVTDRVAQLTAPGGDGAAFTAAIRVGVDKWRVVLESIGQPADPGAAGFVFGFPVQGGVRVGDLVLGRTGIPFKGAAPAVAAFSLFGTARVEHNGQLVAERAPVEVLALTTGVHADDDTHRRMPNARAGDLELLVLVSRLPVSAVPNGFLLMVFEDVEIEVMKHVAPAAPVIPTVSSVRPEDIGTDPFGLKSPDFQGAARAAEAGDLVPLHPVALIATPQPLNSAPALSLPDGIPVEQGSPAPLLGGAANPSFPADTLPQGIAVLQGAPQPLLGGAVNPSAPALTLVQGIPPLNTQPLTIGQGGPLTVSIGEGPVPLAQPSNPQVLPPVPPPTGALPTLVPPATSAP